MKQTLLRIALPEGVTYYPNEFRELLARQEVHGAALPSFLFHYDNGKPANGIPEVRTIGAKGWVGILAKQEHEDLIYQVMGTAVRALTKTLGKPVRPQVEQHEFGLERRNEPQRYWIREMALKRRYPRARAMDIDELIRERLTKSIERMALQYGLDCPTAEDLGIMVKTTRHLGMPLSTTAGVTKEYVTLANAEFLIHAELKGFWFAGNLTARGYGRIGAFRPHMEMRAPGARGSLQ